MRVLSDINAASSAAIGPEQIEAALGQVSTATLRVEGWAHSSYRAGLTRLTLLTLLTLLTRLTLLTLLTYLTRLTYVTLHTTTNTYVTLPTLQSE